MSVCTINKNCDDIIESELDEIKDALNGFKFEETSQAAWEALATKDPKTIYLFTS